MELQFTKDTHGMWVSEFEVNSDFNLHIERTKGGIISLYQRTTGGGWDHVDAFEYVRHQASIDFDCTALVYPKWCKIESEVEPRYAAITTDGEVTEIKSQSKEVEITANGVTEIAPDAGFGYLNGVTVNVNVPQSGGSGGGESGGGSGGTAWRYFDISSNPSLAQPLSEVAMLIVGTSAEMGGRVIIAACGMLLISDLVVLGVAADASQRYENPRMSSDIGPVLDSLKQMLPDGFNEITKEEFYNLGA